MKTETICTERLILNPISKDDSERLFPLYRKSTIEDYCHSLETIDDMKRYIANDLTMKVIPWVIELDQKPIGVFNISPDETDSDWEVGYFIDSEYQRMGYASEALSAGLRYCIENYWADNIEAGITHHNEASINLVKKLGFKYGKTCEKDWEWNGVLHDSVYYYLKKENLK